MKKKIITIPCEPVPGGVLGAIVEESIGGMIVTSVRPSTIASQLGFKVDDIILSINESKMSSLEDLRIVIKSGKNLQFKIQRPSKDVWGRPINN